MIGLVVHTGCHRLAIICHPHDDGCGTSGRAISAFPHMYPAWYVARRRCWRRASLPGGKWSKSRPWKRDKWNIKANGVVPDKCYDVFWSDLKRKRLHFVSKIKIRLTHLIVESFHTSNINVGAIQIIQLHYKLLDTGIHSCWDHLRCSWQASKCKRDIRALLPYCPCGLLSFPIQGWYRITACYAVKSRKGPCSSLTQLIGYFVCWNVPEVFSGPKCDPELA